MNLPNTECHHLGLKGPRQERAECGKELRDADDEEDKNSEIEKMVWEELRDHEDGKNKNSKLQNTGPTDT